MRLLTKTCRHEISVNRKHQIMFSIPRLISLQCVPSCRCHTAPWQVSSALGIDLCPPSRAILCWLRIRCIVFCCVKANIQTYNSRVIIIYTISKNSPRTFQEILGLRAMNLFISSDTYFRLKIVHSLVFLVFVLVTFVPIIKRTLAISKSSKGKLVMKGKGFDFSWLELGKYRSGLGVDDDRCVMKQSWRHAFKSFRIRLTLLGI